MKMDFTHEELLAYAEDAEEILTRKLDSLITEHGSGLTLEQMLSARNEVFHSSYRSFIKTVEEGDYTFDYQQIGRFSHLLFQQVEQVWLEYVL